MRQANLGVFRQAGTLEAMAQVLAKPHVMLFLTFGSILGHPYFDSGQGLGVDVLAFVLRNDKGGVRAISWGKGGGRELGQESVRGCRAELSLGTH